MLRGQTGTGTPVLTALPTPAHRILALLRIFFWTASGHSRCRRRFRRGGITVSTASAISGKVSRSMLGIARRIAAMLEAGAEADLLDQARTHAVAATGHDLESRLAYNLTGGGAAEQDGAE